MLVKLTTGDIFLADGGYYVDGRVFCKVDESQILEIGEKIKTSEIRNVVIAGKTDPKLLNVIKFDLTETLVHVTFEMWLY